MLDGISPADKVKKYLNCSVDTSLKFKNNSFFTYQLMEKKLRSQNDSLALLRDVRVIWPSSPTRLPPNRINTNNIEFFFPIPWDLNFENQTLDFAQKQQEKAWIFSPSPNLRLLFLRYITLINVLCENYQRLPTNPPFNTVTRISLFSRPRAPLKKQAGLAE